MDKQNASVNSLLIAQGSSLSILNLQNLIVNTSLDNSGWVLVNGGSLTVDGRFTNEANAHFNLNDSGDVANINALNNLGFINVASGATLNLSQSMTDLPGNLSIEGTTNAANALETIEGVLASIMARRLRLIRALVH